MNMASAPLQAQSLLATATAWGSDAQACLDPARRAPALGQLVAAALREDFSLLEARYLAQSPEAARLLQRALDRLWRPSPRQLYLHQLGRLTVDESEDVEHRLHIDRAAQAWRTLRLLSADAGLAQIAALAPRRLDYALEQVELARQPLQRWTAPAPGLFASTPRWEQHVTAEDASTSFALIRDANGERLQISVANANSVRGGLARVTIGDAEGRAVWSSYAVLHGTSAGKVGRLEVPTSNEPRRWVAVRWIRPADVAFESSAMLRAAWRKQLRLDPESETAWSDWTAQARAARWRGKATLFDDATRYGDIDRWLCETAEG